MQSGAPQRIGCTECDLIVSLGDVQGGESARCPRCRHLLTVCTQDAFTRALAFALAASALLVMANSFPFLELEQSGIERVMTIPRAGLELWQDGDAPLAVMVLAPIVVIPAFMTLTIMALALPLRSGRNAPWLVGAARLFFLMNPWSMVEVFVIGVLVSLVKISALATVVIGLSFWAYLGFALCFILAISCLDRFQVWRAIREYQT